MLRASLHEPGDPFYFSNSWQQQGWSEGFSPWGRRIGRQPTSGESRPSNKASASERLTSFATRDAVFLGIRFFRSICGSSLLNRSPLPLVERVSRPVPSMHRCFAKRAWRPVLLFPPPQQRWSEGFSPWGRSIGRQPTSGESRPSNQGLRPPKDSRLSLRETLFPLTTTTLE